MLNRKLKTFKIKLGLPSSGFEAEKLELRIKQTRRYELQ